MFCKKIGINVCQWSCSIISIVYPIYWKFYSTQLLPVDGTDSIGYNIYDAILLVNYIAAIHFFGMLPLYHPSIVGQYRRPVLWQYACSTEAIQKQYCSRIAAMLFFYIANISPGDIAATFQKIVWRQYGPPV